MTCRKRIRHIALLLALLLGNAAQAFDDVSLLIVDLTINYQNMGDAFVLQDGQGDFYLDESALLYWEIARPWPSPERYRGTNYYRLSHFAGTRATFNGKTLAMDVFMPANLMPTRTVSLREKNWAPRTDAVGAYMDYELSWLGHGSNLGDSAYGMFRPVVFGGFGNVGANLVYQERSNDRGPGLNVADLTYTWDDPERLRSIRAGDVLTNPGGHGRALRIGGIQLATNFATQPTLITYPLPEFYGQTEVPSALDIYVNGRLSRTQQVQPGSYLLEDIPVINGLGQMQVVATDALGRQQVFTQDFYLSTDLLMDGLSDYSFTLGALREEFGLENFRYGELAGSATWRHGVNSDLTIESHGEFTDGLMVASGGLHYGIDTAGTISAGFGVSSGDPGTGVRLQFGFQRRTNFLNLNFDISGSTKSYQLVGAATSTPRLQVIAAAGKNFFEHGSVGFSMVHQDYYDRPKRTIWSLDYSKRLLDRLSMSSYLSFLDSSQNDLSIGIRLSMPFGNNHSARGGLRSSRSGLSMDAAIQRNLPMNSGFGYHVALGKTENSFIDAGVAAQSEYGFYSLDVRNSEMNGTSWQAGTRGSVAFLGGMTSFSRQVNDAFAVVNVGNLEGVRVYAENLEIGRTNKNGQVFVPRLRPYLRNQLRIELDDVPLNARISDTEITATPYFKSGIVVNFDVSVSTNVLFRAVWPDGKPLPEGAIGKVFHTGDKYPVGMDGKLYLQGIDRSSEVEIRWNGMICDVDVPYPSGDAIIAKMGDIVCIPRKDR